MNILVTGGAGYIGSHVAKQLLENTEHNIIIIDNLSTGNQKTLQLLKEIRSFGFIKEDLGNYQGINRILSLYNIDTVMHFAASIVVPESVVDPLKYYRNNTSNTTNLIDCAVENGISKFIFSSTAAVYGETQGKETISEDSPACPITPYGMSKLMSEKILVDVSKAHKSMKYVIFRYFNVAGADIHYANGSLKPRIGQLFPGATHLIKVASECAVGKRSEISIFGNSFSTHDGTGVRDYIHVDDLAAAHIRAIDYLETRESNIFNIGYGRGFSVKEVIDTMKRVSETDYRVTVSAKREGDPAQVIADTQRVKNELGWVPKYDNLEIICKSAYQWELQQCQ